MEFWEFEYFSNFKPGSSYGERYQQPVTKWFQRQYWKGTGTPDKERKTFSAKFPDMSGIIPSKNQTKGRSLFAEAVKYARSVLLHPELYPEYKELKDQSLYNTAIKDYMHSFNPEKAPILKLPKTARAALEKLSLREAQLRALVYINGHKKLTNSLYRKMNGVPSQLLPGISGN